MAFSPNDFVMRSKGGLLSLSVLLHLVTESHKNDCGRVVMVLRESPMPPIQSCYLQLQAQTTMFMIHMLVLTVQTQMGFESKCIKRVGP
jgi:hypothetical protein